MPPERLPNAFARAWAQCGIQVTFAGRDRRPGGYERHRRSKNWWTLSILLGGQQRIVTADRALEVLAPAACVIPPETPFRELAPAGQIDAFTAGFYVILPRRMVNPLTTITLPQVVALDDPGAWRSSLDEAAACFRDHRPIDYGHCLKARFPVDRLLHGYLAGLPWDDRGDGRFEQQMPKWLFDLRNRLQDHFQQTDLGFANVLRWSGFTASHVNHAFKRHLGVSPMRFLREERLRRAARFLENNPEVKVAELALVHGYRNAALFTRHFTAKFGVSPRVYRRDRILGSRPD